MAIIVLNGTEALGYIGGVVLSVSLLPQLRKTWVTRSTKDIAYGWQIIYNLGLILTFIYLVLVKATAAWITMTLEIFFSFFLLGMKVNFDGCEEFRRKLDEHPYGPSTGTDPTNDLEDCRNIQSSIGNSCTTSRYNTVDGTVHSSINDSNIPTQSAADIVPYHHYYRHHHHFMLDATFAHTLSTHDGQSLKNSILHLLTEKPYHLNAVEMADHITCTPTKESVASTSLDDPGFVWILLIQSRPSSDLSDEYAMVTGHISVHATFNRLVVTFAISSVLSWVPGPQRLAEAIQDCLLSLSKECDNEEKNAVHCRMHRFLQPVKEQEPAL
jgi:uncharacterized protein with PQ loop repeat